MANRGRRNSRKLSRTRHGPGANVLNTEQTNYRSMATEALRLLLAQHNLVQTGTRQQLVAHLETHFNTPPSTGITVTDTSSTNTLPQQGLPEIIFSFIDETLAARQDGGQEHNWLAPTPHTGSIQRSPVLMRQVPPKMAANYNNRVLLLRGQPFLPSIHRIQPTSPLSILIFVNPCLPAVNQGRSEEISRDGMVCLRRRVSASCLPQPFPHWGNGTSSYT